jgi:hypothetical protein
VLFAARDANQVTLDEVMRTIVARIWGAPVPMLPAERAVQRASQRAMLDVLLDLAGDTRAMPDVRSAAIAQVKQLRSRLAATAGRDAAGTAHIVGAVHDIDRFLSGGDKPELRPRFPVLVLPWP